MSGLNLQQILIWRLFSIVSSVISWYNYYININGYKSLFLYLIKKIAIGGKKIVKKCKLIIVICILVFSISGCSRNESEPETYTDLLKQISTEIVRCFDEKDVDGIYNLMSQSSKDQYYIETQIQEAFEFYEGQSKKAVTTGFQREGLMKDFVDETRFYNPVISITTNLGEHYSFYYEYYFIDTDHPENVGLKFIKFLKKIEDIEDIQEHPVAFIGGNIEGLYRYTEMPFTRNPEYTNAVKNPE